LEFVEFPKNTFLIQSGKICRKSGFMLQGVMRYFAANQHGDEPTCYFTFEGHYIVDPFNYNQQKPSTINLKSITDCTVALISFENDTILAKAFPKWKDITNKMLLDVSMEFANQKTIIALSASERYKYFTDHYPQLALRVPLQYIASYLGIAQPSLSRLRKELTRNK
jgi:CRP-like cAMP-binding protein